MRGGCQRSEAEGTGPGEPKFILVEGIQRERRTGCENFWESVHQVCRQSCFYKKKYVGFR